MNAIQLSRRPFVIALALLLAGWCGAHAKTDEQHGKACNAPLILSLRSCLRQSQGNAIPTDTAGSAVKAAYPTAPQTPFGGSFFAVSPIPSNQALRWIELILLAGTGVAAAVIYFRESEAAIAQRREIRARIVLPPILLLPPLYGLVCTLLRALVGS